MKLPPGVTFHFGSWRLGPGDEVPAEIESRLPEEVRLKAAKAHAQPVPEPDVGESVSFSPGGRRR